MAKHAARTVPTGASVPEFIRGIEGAARQADARKLVKLMSEASGWKPKMWGPSIIGFGAYHYTYESGHAGSICAIGFSPRKANFAIYAADFAGSAELRKKLGRHKGGGGQCLYITRVDDIDAAVLVLLLKGGLAETRRRWPVSP